MYGPTETTIWSTVGRVSDAAETITIGRPIANTQTFILETSGQLAPAGVVGELCIGGEGVARGYRKRPELTAEKFVPVELPNGRTVRLYRTGDLARFRGNGELELLGRRDHQVKVRGYRVELGEIEAVLAGCPGVKACVVVVRAFSPSDERLVAYVTLLDDMAFDAETARTGLRRKLPEYMIPALFVVLSTLPLTPNNKLDRNALPPPSVPAGCKERPAKVLMTPDQRCVAELWQDVLQVDHVGLNENFFDLGGHSLLLVKLHAGLKQEFASEFSAHRTVPADNRCQPGGTAVVNLSVGRCFGACPDPSRKAISWLRWHVRAGAPVVSHRRRSLSSGWREGSRMREALMISGATYARASNCLRRSAMQNLMPPACPASLRSDKQFVRKGTTLEGAELFDAGFFGVSPREAQILDPQHRIFLECAWEALEHAGYAPGATQKTVGVYAGSSMNTYLFAQILRDPALIDAVGGYQLMLGNDKDFLCTRVSYKLDLRGPSMNVQTACSTSLVAVEVACRALQNGECDMALAGGVSVSFPQRAGYLYQDGMIFSPDGHCRPFDAAAAGTRAGAGAGIVVLKRLADALADRDTIHAVIRGAAINNDGAGKAGYTAPSIDGQVEVIATAQALAGVDPRSISYIEAHGTATPLGDPIEIAALTRVFRAATSDIGFCRLGSLKANLGHLDAAAGVAGLIKTVLALKHREFPPLVNFRSPNPQLDLERSPFTAIAEASAWPGGESPRRAGVSSFGIGGTNAHVVLEEAPAIASAASRRDQHLLVLSARTETALEQATTNLADFLEGRPDVSLPDVEWTLQIGRKAFAHRRALVAQDVAQAVQALRQPRQAPVLTAVHEGGTRPVAFLFSGQGGQHAGMGAALYDSEPQYRDAVDRCAALLEPHLGLDIRTIIFASDGDSLVNETRYAQPALFCTEYALAMLWMQWGVSPHAMIGHSIGEYVAAHLAGVFSLADAVAVVATRGRLMQALPAGTMAAVHLPASELASRVGGGVEIAAENAPGLCTISGPSEGDGRSAAPPRSAGHRVPSTAHIARLPLFNDGSRIGAVQRNAERRSIEAADHPIHIERDRHLDYRGSGHHTRLLRQPHAPARAVRIGYPHARSRSRTVLPGGRAGQHTCHPDPGDAWPGEGHHHNVVVVSSAPA